MSARQPSPYDSVASKWFALAERRLAHVAELRDSGRWRLYHTSADFSRILSEAVRMRDEWARIAGIAPEVPEG